MYFKYSYNGINRSWLQSYNNLYNSYHPIFKEKPMIKKYSAHKYRFFENVIIAADTLNWSHVVFNDSISVPLQSVKSDKPTLPVELIDQFKIACVYNPETKTINNSCSTFKEFKKEG